MRKATSRARRRAPAPPGLIARPRFRAQRDHLHRRQRHLGAAIAVRPPHRAAACPASSTASTPFSTGTDVSSATRASPEVADSATSRKCSVSPRISTPNASTASNRPEAAAQRQASGSSKRAGHPDHLEIVRTPRRAR